MTHVWKMPTAVIGATLHRIPTMEARGAFMSLLVEIMRSRKGIPADCDDKRLKQIIGAYRIDHARKILQSLLDCGEIEITETGHFWARVLNKAQDYTGRRPLHPAIRREVMERDDHQCVYCGSEKYLEIDHVHPFSRGGSDHPENLAAACHDCNRSKGAMTLDEWRAACG